MKTPFLNLSVCLIAFLVNIGLLENSYADENRQYVRDLSEDITEDLNAKLKEIRSKTLEIKEQVPDLKQQAPELRQQVQEIKKQTPDLKQQAQDIKKQVPGLQQQVQVIKNQDQKTQALTKLQQAEKSGLSRLVKTISPEGGRFEFQTDGSIRIIPNDDSIVRKLLDKGPLQKTEPSSDETRISDSTSKSEIPKNSKEIIDRLRKANNQGLSNLLNKLATGGGKFELIENGGIRIIPNNPDKAKELAKKSKSAKKLVKKKDLKGVSKNLRGMSSRVNTWTKVRNVAKKWLKKNNKKGLSIGKIRRIKWLYLVSIVTEKGSMDTQLVVRASDGKTVAFTQKEFEVFN